MREPTGVVNDYTSIFQLYVICFSYTTFRKPG